MKRIITYIIAISFFISIKSFGQFGANQAVWHFSVPPFMPPPVLTTSIVTSGSSVVINGITCRTIITSPGCQLEDTFYVYQSNDSVYYYLANTNRFTLLYNFNAQVGDTMKIYVNNTGSSGEDSLLIKVDSTFMININGFTKKAYSTSPIFAFPFSTFQFAGTVIEDIGNTWYVFPQSGVCDPPNSGLRCYEDTVIGLYQPIYPQPCDTTIYLGVDEASASQIYISPNPVTKNLNIEFQKIKSTINSNIIIRNIFGNVVYNIVLKNNEPEFSIDVSEFSNGVYFVEVRNESEKIIRKIIINH